MSAKVPTVRDILRGEVLTLHPSQTETQDGNSGDFYIGHAKTVIFVLDVTAFGGTTPTLDVKIQNKDPVSGKYDDAVTFTQVGEATSTQWKYAPDSGKELANHIRVVWTLGGTNPSYKFSVSAILKHN